MSREGKRSIHDVTERYNGVSRRMADKTAMKYGRRTFLARRWGGLSPRRQAWLRARAAKQNRASDVRSRLRRRKCSREADRSRSARTSARSVRYGAVSLSWDDAGLDRTVSRMSTRTDARATGPDRAASIGKIRRTTIVAFFFTSRRALMFADRRLMLVFFHGHGASLERDVLNASEGSDANFGVECQCRFGGAAVRG